MIYRSIIKEGLDLAGQQSGGDFETMLKRSVNRHYRRLLALVDQDDERREFTLTLVADQSQYGLPIHVKRILNIEDATNKRPVTEFTAQEYDARFAGTSSTGPPRKYYPFGRFGVQVKPSAASQLTISSSAAGDSGNRYVRVAALDSNNVWTTERVALTGTTEVQTVNTYAAQPIESITKFADDGFSISGNITITDGTTTLAVIPVPVDSPRYQWIEFYPIPDSALSLTIRAIMRKPDLVNDEDWVQFDEDFHGLLVSGPMSELLPVVGKNTLAGRMKSEFDDMVKEFKSTQQRRPNRVLEFSNVTNQPRTNDKAVIGTLDGVSVQ